MPFLDCYCSFAFVGETMDSEFMDSAFVRACVRTCVSTMRMYICVHCTFVHFISLRSHKHIFGILVCCDERCFQEQLRDCAQPLGE